MWSIKNSTPSCVFMWVGAIYLTCEYHPCIQAWYKPTETKFQDIFRTKYFLQGPRCFTNGTLQCGHRIVAPFMNSFKVQNKWLLGTESRLQFHPELSLHPSTGVMRHLMQKVPNELTTNPTQIFWRPLHLWSESLWSCCLTLNVGLAVKVFSGSWPETSPLKFIFSNALRSCPNPFKQNQGCKPTMRTSIMITTLSVILVMCTQHSHWATPPPQQTYSEEVGLEAARTCDDQWSRT